MSSPQRPHAGWLLSRAVMLSVVVIGAGQAGCGSEEATDLERAEAQLKVVGVLYGKYVRQYGGAPPADEEQLVAYLTANRGDWEMLVDGPSDMLVSPFDGKPLIIHYGKQLPQDGASMWIAREQDGVDGRPWIVSARGEVRQIEQAALGEYFSPPME